MKKALLFTFIITIAFALNAQYAQIIGPNKNLALKQLEIHPDLYSPHGSSVIGQKEYPQTIIGTTWYDSQSYGNVMPRMHEYPDGTVGAIWMAAGEGITNPERGAGYNYFNGTEWGTPNLHVGQDDRHGWPNYCAWGANGEIISVYHYDGVIVGPLLLFKRETKGEGEWEEIALYGPEATSLVWHSMMTSGENHEHIHILAFSYDVPVQGQEHALLYFRSSDGGETWDIDGIVIEGLGSDYYITIESLSYTWANPVGNTIAFTYGFDIYGGKIFKSDDNGDTWDIIEVFDWPYDPLDPPEDSPVVPCGSGTNAIALDSDGKAHVVFPRMRNTWVGGEVQWSPYTDGLIYWNEDMPLLDTTTISSYTLDYLADAGNLLGWVMSEEPYEIPENQPNYGEALCGFPQISIDEQNNMFVAYSSLSPEYSSGEFFYRHIVANSSWDGGNTWNGQIDLNTDISFIFSECAYPELTPTLGNTLHLVFQEDEYPGIKEWQNNHEYVENHMYYFGVPKDVFVGVEENEIALNFELSQNFPNPARLSTQFNLRLNDKSNVTIHVVNVVGQSVKQLSMGSMDTGNHRITLDVSDLTAGIYYYSVNVDGQIATRKIVVQ
jgi:hypothetical protein